MLKCILEKGEIALFIIKYLFLPGGSAPVQGDVLVIVGSTLYAISNASEVNIRGSYFLVIADSFNQSYLTQVDYSMVIYQRSFSQLKYIYSTTGLLKLCCSFAGNVTFCCSLLNPIVLTSPI
jgi:Solute carrier family 35